MTSRDFRIASIIVGVNWVGGGGFLFFRYPEFFAKLNTHLGFRKYSSPKYIVFLKWMGFVEMILAGISAIGATISFAFGLNWF
jgi:hypothetical protein